MTKKDTRIIARSGALTISSAGSTVTVEPSGARSVNLGQVLKSPRAREQLEQIQKIQDRQANRGQDSNANNR